MRAFGILAHFNRHFLKNLGAGVSGDKEMVEAAGRLKKQELACGRGLRRLFGCSEGRGAARHGWDSVR